MRAFRPIAVVAVLAAFAALSALYTSADALPFQRLQSAGPVVPLSPAPVAAALTTKTLSVMTCDGKTTPHSWMDCIGAYPTRLPACHGVAQWTDCMGSYSDSSGSYGGEWKNGRADGEGIYDWRNGDVYFGQFQADKMTGLGMKHIGKTGQYYIGQWSDGERNGQGTLYGPSGAVLQRGTWQADKFVSGN